MDMNNPTCKIVIDSPQEAHHLISLRPGVYLRNVDISKVLKRIDNDPQKLVRKNIRISNEHSSGNLLIMKVFPTKVRNVVDFIIFPNMTLESNFDYTNYDTELENALKVRKTYKLEVF